MIPKFRAWDKRKQLMREVAVLHFNKNGNVSGIEYWKTPYDLQSIHANYINVMQSTGLKDKNGVEIFEGDIVKIIGDVLGDDMSVIRFTEGGFYLDYKNLDTEFELLYSIDLPIEIIGNIYENPELLEAIE